MTGEGMESGVTGLANTSRSARDLTRDAIALALNGEWERASEVNRTVLELSEDDVDAMNRLSKALMELARYSEAREVLDRVTILAPYNKIAKKNLARLDQLETTPAASNQVRKAGGALQLFIEESGKSGTTILIKAVTGQVAAWVAPSDAVTLLVEKDVINVYTQEGDYLGQIEPKLGRRLIKMMDGGNQYQAAIIGVSNHGISITVRETYRHQSLQNVCSFPTKSKEEHRVYLSETMVRYTRDDNLDDNLDDDEDDEVGIVEDDMEDDWSDNE
jgi:tetratricopeptide (TPR) repeat protein